jgi:membrane fusion protein (multidrug efflux system)
MNSKSLLSIPLLCWSLASTAGAVDFETTQLQTGDITRSIQLLGEVKPYQQITLYAKVSGYVHQVNVEMGDAVTAGRPLIELEVPELIAQAAKAQAELNLAEVEAKHVREAAAKAPELVTQQARDIAEAHLLVAQAQQQHIQTLISFAHITAPFAGTITRRMIDPGAFVPAATSNNPSSQAALLTLTDAARLRVQAAVPEYEAPLVNLGQPFTFTIDAATPRTVKATVTRHSHSLDATTKTLLVEAEVANPDGSLQPGTFANVKLGIETHRHTSLLPVAVVVMEKTTAVAFVYQQGKAVRKVLKAGFNDGTNVEVLGGLAPEDKVLVVGTATVTDGQTVTLAPAK